MAGDGSAINEDGDNGAGISFGKELRNRVIRRWKLKERRGLGEMVAIKEAVDKYCVDVIDVRRELGVTRVLKRWEVFNLPSRRALEGPLLKATVGVVRNRRAETTFIRPKGTKAIRGTKIFASRLRLSLHKSRNEVRWPLGVYQILLEVNGPRDGLGEGQEGEGEVKVEGRGRSRRRWSRSRAMVEVEGSIEDGHKDRGKWGWWWYESKSCLPAFVNQTWFCSRQFRNQIMIYARDKKYARLPP
ncbi:hypothetical protein DFH06DRAFT_1133306 [Mycena polygramma]|nr:hypothetical protein DFH06DRAFT_1133306 [Mycena polygramma]